MSLYSGRVTLALSRIQRLLSQHGVDFQLNGEWTLDELNALCEQVDDMELFRQLAIVQSETGQVFAA